MATPTTGLSPRPSATGPAPFKAPSCPQQTRHFQPAAGLVREPAGSFPSTPDPCCSLSAPSAAATPPISFRSPPQSRRSSPATSAREARRSPAPAPATLPRPHLPLESPHQMPDLLVRRRAAESPKFAPHGFRAQTLAGGVEGGDSRRRVPGASRAAIIAGRLLGVVVSGASGSLEMGQSGEGRGAVPHSMLGSGPEPVLPVDEPVRLRGRKGDRRG